MKKRAPLMWVIGMLLLAAFTVSAQDNQAVGETARTNPMKKGDVIKALESNAISGAELVFLQKSDRNACDDKHAFDVRPHHRPALRG